MSRHEFIVVVPVADRPRHIQACLTSLRAALQRFPYAGRIRVLIADDSADAASIEANRTIARQFSADGLEVIHFPPEEQYALVESLGINLPRVLGAAPPDNYGHKGQGVMRNIAYLKVAEMLSGQPDDNALIWSIDSDQEFRVNVEEEDGYIVDFFNGLDAIFARTDAQLLTGKVVGDPPVSPAVMTRNFLDDVLAFLAQMAERNPAAACGHHAAPQASGDAAYHDMADLFGFKPADSYAYPCPLHDAHTEADCFANFSARVNSFFYGEHPTRVSGYVPGELFASVQPARTVYAGNYVFRPAALKYFIPFAALRLRMSGPTLGRIVKSELGTRFVSANLPMLHKRTVESGGQSEFRPGIDTHEQVIDMSGEFERQFYGDVMLFSVEKLTAACRLASTEFLDETLAGVRTEMLEKYNVRQRAILGKLDELEALLVDTTHWWNHTPEQAAGFRQFAANVRRNFGEASSGHARINDTANWAQWRSRLLEALTHYAEDRTAWSQLL
jgi:hypothetical protein